MTEERQGTPLIDGLVSVIMPVYNDTMYIRDAVQSVLRQTYPSWELWIVDDASTMDVRSEVADLLTDKRIHFLRLSENRTAAGARNAGIRAARGRYLAFLDSDDLWLPKKLEKQIRFMKEKAASVSFTSYRRFQGEVKNVGRVVEALPYVDYARLLRGNPIGCLTVMADQWRCPEIEMPLMRHEDYITWLTIAKQGVSLYGLAEDLARYRVSNTSLSGNKFKSLWWTWKVYRKSQGLSFFRSLLCLGYYIAHGIRKRC